MKTGAIVSTDARRTHAAVPDSSSAGRLVARVAALAPFAIGAAMPAPQADGQGIAMRPGHVGAVLGMEAGAGGDDAAYITYTDDSSATMHAGDGVEIYAGLHYRPLKLPVDFAGMVGYKFDSSADRDSTVRFTRWTLRLTGTWELPRGLWVDAGPVWHLSPTLQGGMLR